MSVPSVIYKGCVPELSLVGSRVAVLEPLGYRLTPANSRCSSGCINQRLTILPDISAMPAQDIARNSPRCVKLHTPTHYVSSASLRGQNPATPIHNISGGSPMCVNMASMHLQHNADGFVFHPQPSVNHSHREPAPSSHREPAPSSHRELAPGCQREPAPGSSQTDTQGQGWVVAGTAPTDSDIHSQALRLERFNMSKNRSHRDNTPSGNRCSIDSSPAVDDPAVAAGVDVVFRRTWHSELVREMSQQSTDSQLSTQSVPHTKHAVLRMSQGLPLDHHRHTQSEDSHTTFPETLPKDKPRREKKRRKRRTSKVGLNKVSRTKTRSAGRSRQLLATRETIPTASHHGNPNAVMITQCKAIKVLPSPPKAPKPKLLTYQLITHHTAHKSNMGATVSHSTNKSRISPVSLVTQRSADTLTVTPQHNSSDVQHSQSDARQEQLRRIIKVYCSDRQSGVLKEMGVERPCAPPATPMPDMLNRYEYIPSMNDVRSQRAIKVRLEAMGKVEKVKQEKLKEEKQRNEKAALKGKEKDLKRRQRLEIYALNKLMTEFENANFAAFCEKNGLRTKKK